VQRPQGVQPFHFGLGPGGIGVPFPSGQYFGRAAGGSRGNLSYQSCLILGKTLRRQSLCSDQQLHPRLGNLT